MTAHDPEVDAERDKEGQTALHRAVRGRNTDEARALIARGASLQVRRMDGKTALHLACESGMTWLVERALKEGADVDDMSNWSRETPLAIAVMYDHLDVARLLVSRRANVNLRGSGGGTALYWARTREMAELLLGAGARADHQNNEKGTPLHAAAGRGHADVIEALVRHGAKVDAPGLVGRTPLMDAARDRTLAALSKLIALGAEVDRRSQCHGTALHWASRYGELEAMRLLLDHGADPNARNAYAEGRTPLHDAAEQGKTEAVALLVARGADPELTTTDGKKPIHVASTAAARAALPQDPAVAARTREGERIVEELSWLGFFSFVARGRAKAVKAKVVDSYVSARTLAAFGERSVESQHRREIPADAEELAEGGIAAALSGLEEVLAEQGVTLDEARDDVDDQGYTVVVNGASYVVWQGADGARFGWEDAYRRFIAIGNQLLEAAGSAERLWAMGYSGNDSSVLLLTPELYDYLRSLDLDEAWTPRPLDEVRW